MSSAEAKPPRSSDEQGLGRIRDRGGDRLCQARSEEHTSELQSRQYLVCRLLLEKKNIFNIMPYGPLSKFFYLNVRHSHLSSIRSTTCISIPSPFCYYLTSLQFLLGYLLSQFFSY